MCLKTSPFQTGHIDYTNPEEIDFHKLESFLVDNQEEIFFVRIHGGEPLHYSNISELCDLLNSFKLPYDIVTNGSLLTPSLIAKLTGEACINLSISLDAVTPAIYAKMRNGGDIENISNSLNIISQEKMTKKTMRPMLNISMCTFKFNLNEMHKLVDYSKKFNISSISISEGLDYGNYSIGQSDLVVNNKEVTREEITKTLKLAKKEGVKVRYRFPGFNSDPNKDLPYLKGRLLPKDCLNLYSSIWIKPDLDVIACSSSTKILGNLVNQDLNEFWNESDSGYRLLRKEFAQGKVPENCANCIYTGGFFS